MKKLFFSLFYFGLIIFVASAQFAPNAFDTRIDFFCFSTNGSLNLKAVDLNNDNKLDIVVVNQSNGNLSIFKNIGSPTSGLNNGTFAPKIDILVGSGTNTLAYIKAVKINNDNLVDLVICTGTGNSVAILRNTSDTVSGTISFDNPIFLPAQVNTAGLDVADLDNDGKLDIVATNYITNSYSIFKNNGSGSNISFNAAVNIATTENVNPTQIFLTDFDGDGKKDMAICSNGNSRTNIYKNISNTAITFSAVPLALEGNAVVFRGDVGDINNDGKIDIVVSSFSSQTTSVYKNTSVGGVISFEPKVDFQAGSVIQSSRLVDLNNDGKLDLVQSAGGGTDSRINVFENIGQGQTINTNTFSAVTRYGSGDSPTGLDFADLDNDGKVDILQANFAAPTSFSVLKFNTPTGLQSIYKASDNLLFPNPASKKITLTNFIGLVDIVNILGEKVNVNFTNNGIDTEIDLLHLKTGIYFVSYTTNGNLSAKKFIVE